MPDTELHQRPEVWSDCAAEYEDWFVPLSGRVAAEALERVSLERGDRFLDVAAGTGAVTLEAARSGASVTAVDFAPEMLAVLERKLADARLDGVKTLRMDGQALDFADASFDAAGSSFGLIFFPDFARGLAELQRVLVPDGRAFVTSMSRLASSPLMHAILRALQSAGPELRPAAPPARIELSTPEAMESALVSAGFRDVRIDAISVPWTLAEPEGFWKGWALSAPPVAAAMAAVPETVRRAAGLEFVRIVRDETGREFPTDVLIGVGRK